MALRARNSETGEVLELQDGKWVQVHGPRTSVGNAVAGSVEGSRAVGDYLFNLIKAGVTKFAGALEAGSGSFGEPALPPDAAQGPLSPQIPFISGREAPGLLKGALPIAGGLAGGPLGSVVGEGIDQLREGKLSLTELAVAGASPRLARGVFRLGKSAVRGGTGFVVPQAMRESGVELAKNRFSGEASRKIYTQLLQQGKVPTHRIGLVIDRMIAEEAATSAPRPIAIETLAKLKKFLTEKVGTTTRPAPRSLTDKATGFVPKQTVKTFTPVGEVEYKSLVQEVQRLRTDAQFHFTSLADKADKNTGIRLSKTANAMIEELDEISPVFKQANAAFRREESIKALALELRKGNPGVMVRNLFEQDDLVRETFSAVERFDIINIADDIGRFGTGATLGAGNRALMAFVEPAADLLTTANGRRFLRVLIQPPGTNAQKLAEAMGQILNQMRRGTIEFINSGN